MKRIFDILFSLFMIIIWSPIFILIGIAIKLTSKGPAIFKQKRVGLYEKEFYMYKFRSMIVNAENLQEHMRGLNEADGPVFKIKNDPRITFIGKFLRKTNIDEMPQFFNVLMGDMSLVGPRPPVKSEVKNYENWHYRRLSVKPGITCTWQIQPQRHDIKFNDWVKLDLHYIDNQSFTQDIIITFKTIKMLLKN